MRVSGGFRGWGASSGGDTAAGADRSRRSEAVSDLFNNSASNDKKDADVKVRLSHAARRLGEETAATINKFLNVQPELRSHLADIEVDAPPRNPVALKVRQLAAYAQWQKIYSAAEEWESSEQEAPYQAINALGLNEEIQGLFAEQDASRLEVQNQRRRHAPSYYYHAFPEAYSFN
jgi:hypothetical protein